MDLVERDLLHLVSSDPSKRVSFKQIPSLSIFSHPVLTDGCIEFDPLLHIVHLSP